MRKLNKILVPIDFSEESARALKYALSLARETRSELVVLHVIEKTNDSDFFMSSVACLRDHLFRSTSFQKFQWMSYCRKGPSIFGISSGGTLKQTTRSR